MTPNLWPTSTASSMLFPETYAPKNPPANASPAPLVSTINSFAIGVTGYTLCSSSFPPSTTIVASAPCVITTTRGRAVLTLRYFAIPLAISEMSVVSDLRTALAYAWASDSFPMTMSVYGRTCSSWALKNRGIKGAERLKIKVYVHEWTSALNQRVSEVIKANKEPYFVVLRRVPGQLQR